MRAIKQSDEFELPDSAVQRLFLTCWYSLVHQQSLDSHRVRCMNSLSILLELSRLLPKTLRKIELDIAKCAEEAASILEADVVVGNQFGKHLSRLKPILEDLTKETKKENSPTFSKAREYASYYLKDAISELKKDYRSALFSRAEEILADPTPEPRYAELADVTGLLMSVLIDEGKSIDGLYSLLRDIYLKRNPTRARSFEESLTLARRILEHDATEHMVTFRLTGWSETTRVPDTVGIVSFAKDMVFDVDASRLSERRKRGLAKFTSGGQGVTYATVRVQAADQRSAGVQAKEAVDKALDFVRFELEHHRVEVDNEFAVIRVQGNDLRILPLPTAIPNPRTNLSEDDFSAFVGKCNAVLRSESLQRESIDKLVSSIRFYRLGDDSPGMENRFLNWWTALEYLSRTGTEGGIIDQVENRVTSALVLGYVPRLLDDYRFTLDYCGTPVSDTLNANGVSRYADLSLRAFLDTLRDGTETAHIYSSLSEHPYVVVKLKRFAQDIATAKSTYELLLKHGNHLRWHVNRLWRLRCDIVHSAEYTVNLTLLSANLEYYLKTMIGFVLGQVTTNGNIHSLDELFARADDARDCLCKELDKEQEDRLMSLLDHGVRL